MTEVINKRLFLGNVHADVVDSDLRSRFCSFGKVGAIEIRNKNTDYFAFMNMEFEDIHAMRKCVEVMNNTRWKGLTLKVQYAKESFIDKLKRERQQRPTEFLADGKLSDKSVTKVQDQASDTWIDRRQKQKFERPKRPPPPDNFDFEIVYEHNTSGSNDKQKLQHPEISVPDDTLGIPKKEVSTLDSSHKSRSSQYKAINRDSIAQTNVPSKEIMPKKKKKRNVSSSESDDSSCDEKDGIPRFRGLSAYVDILPDQGAVLRNQSKIEESEDKSKPPNESECKPEILQLPQLKTTEFKLKINPHKKAQSNQLRLKSLYVREERLAQSAGIINSALSKTHLSQLVGVELKPTASGTTNNLDDLFDGDENKDENELSFDIKPQYEGLSGQKMLKLKARYGNDERFKLDERFADKSLPSTSELSEKQNQLEILEQLIGPIAKPTSEIITEKQTDFRFFRFDPTQAHHQKLILNSPKPTNNSIEREASAGKNRNKEVGSEAIEVEKASLKNLDVKPTFKVVDNLKLLFDSHHTENSTNTPGTSFSFLKSFGQNPVETKPPASDNKEKNSKPRDNWTKNPFKYDSSDDEDNKNLTNGQKKSKTKKQIDQKESKSTGPQNFFKKENFFYSTKDERLKGVFKQFLESTEDPVQISQEFNENQRKELKAIAKSKMKNSKRKIEKKVKIRRLKRKKKQREDAHKQKKMEAGKNLKS